MTEKRLWQGRPQGAAGLVAMAAAALCAVCSLLSGPAFAALPPADAHFVDKVLRSGLAAVAIGSLARERGGSEGVRRLGDSMMEERAAMNVELVRIAREQGVEPALGMGAPDRRRLPWLNRLRGNAFDASFVRYVLQAHRDDIRRFDRAKDHLQLNALRSFALRQLPQLRRHLQRAQVVQAALPLKE